MQGERAVHALHPRQDWAQPHWFGHTMSMLIRAPALMKADRVGTLGEIRQALPLAAGAPISTPQWPQKRCY